MHAHARACGAGTFGLPCRRRRHEMRSRIAPRAPHYASLHDKRASRPADGSGASICLCLQGHCPAGARRLSLTAGVGACTGARGLASRLLVTTVLYTTSCDDAACPPTALLLGGLVVSCHAARARAPGWRHGGGAAGHTAGDGPVGTIGAWPLRAWWPAVRPSERVLWLCVICSLLWPCACAHQSLTWL